MATPVNIPTALRAYTNQQGEVSIDGATVGEILNNLAESFPQLKKHIYDDAGKLRSFVNVYLNDDDIRYLQKSDTEVNDGDTISIVPSIAGGAI